jgi:translation initiation factor IF-3
MADGRRIMAARFSSLRHMHPPIPVIRYIPSKRSYNEDVRKRIINEYITHPIVRLVNPKTKALDPPKPLKEVIASIDTSVYNLELVAVNPDPIVRLLTKDDTRKLHAKDRAEARSRRKSQASKKQIQMTWVVEPRDLMRKLEKGKKEIKKGNMVNVVLAKKKAVPLPSRGLKMKKMDEIKAIMADVADEWCPRSIGTQLAVMFFKPKGNDAPSAEEAKAMRAEVEEIIDVEGANTSDSDD